MLGQMKSEISVIGWNSSEVLVFNNFFLKKYLILQQNSGIPAVYLKNTKISQLKSEQCMKLEKLVIHTGSFLQKCNTHTTISVLFWNKEWKKEEFMPKGILLPAAESIRVGILSIAFMYPCRSPNLPRYDSST